MPDDVPLPLGFLLRVNVVQVHVAIVVALLGLRPLILILRRTLLHPHKVEDEPCAHPPPLDFVLPLLRSQLIKLERGDILFHLQAAATVSRQIAFGQRLPHAIDQPLTLQFISPELLLHFQEIRSRHDHFVLRPLRLLPFILLTLIRPGEII